MSEMIKRTAHAIRSVPHGEMLAREFRIVVARAVIEAMLAPTQAMRLAGIAEYARNDIPASEGTTIVFDRIYNAMIAEALK